MNEASQWRRELVTQLAQLYADNSKVAAVMIGGSSARGHADQYSDVEIGAFWRESPTQQDREQIEQQFIKSVPVDSRLYEYDADYCVWSDDYLVGRDHSGQPKTGILVEVCNYTTDFMERTLRGVLNDYDTREMSHNLIAGVVDSVPLHGAVLLEDWKVRASDYPRALSTAVVQTYGVIDHFWRWEMYVQRGENLVLLYQSFANVHQRLLHTLLGLNRVYYFGFKWIEVVAERLIVKPDDLVMRIRQAYQLPPTEGAQQVIALVEDTFNLVETHLPEVNIKRLREIFRYRRPIWTHSPFDV
jgi:predicted nucleotidyltransferase